MHATEAARVLDEPPPLAALGEQAEERQLERVALKPRPRVPES